MQLKFTGKLELTITNTDKRQIRITESESVSKPNKRRYGVIYVGEIFCRSCLTLDPVEFDPPLRFEDQEEFEWGTKCRTCGKFDCFLTHLFTGSEEEAEIDE